MYKNTAIRERVIYLCQKHNVDQKVLANHINAPPTTVNGWFKHENRNPSSEYLIPICVFFDVSIEWLLTGVEAKPSVENEDEELLLNTFRNTDAIGRARIIQVVMNQRDETEIRKNTIWAG